MRTKVTVVRCADYECSSVDKAIKQCLELIPTDKIPRNKKILLKPNLLSSTKGPDIPINTHPAIVEAVAKIFINEYGCIVYVGDSSGGMSYGQTKRSFEVSGLIDVSKRVGIKLINFENTGIVRLSNPSNKIKKEFPVSKIINEVDFIISLPKLKTHSLVGFTGAMKNMMGLVPGSGKRDMHISAPRKWEMENCIVDLYGLVKPHFVIMDAVISMEGDGPAAGSPRESRILLAGEDAVAVDTVALEVAGYKSKEMFFINDADKRGFGVGDIEEIEIVGEKIENVKIKDFKKPVGKVTDRILNFIPGSLMRKMFEGMTSGMPFIIQGLCRRCNVCYDSCPVKTIIKLPDGKLKIDKNHCIECYCCHEFCPHNAIKIKIPLSVRFIRRSVTIVRSILKK
jgi:uncharacterized protein (DUF362 family)/Pyruvate/2-oxoacid:ferredoxin oxidoreductase delta subunit